MLCDFEIVTTTFLPPPRLPPEEGAAVVVVDAEVEAVMILAGSIPRARTRSNNSFLVPVNVTSAPVDLALRRYCFNCSTVGIFAEDPEDAILTILNL